MTASSERRESPLFLKTRDYAVWLLRHTAKFTKLYRHSLTERAENAVLSFQRELGRASISGDDAALCEASLRLWELRQLLRMAHELGFFPASQLEFSTVSLDELGRLLGAWKRKKGESA